MEVFLEKLAVPHLIKKFPHFMEFKRSLPRSQQPITASNLSQINPVHAFPILFLGHLL